MKKSALTKCEYFLQNTEIFTRLSAVSISCSDSKSKELCRARNISVIRLQRSLACVSHRVLSLLSPLCAMSSFFTRYLCSSGVNVVSFTEWLRQWRPTPGINGAASNGAGHRRRVSWRLNADGYWLFIEQKTLFFGITCWTVTTSY